MSRSVKIALGLFAFVVGLNVLLSLLGSLSGGTPGGPTSSSYATGRTGLAAYAALLAEAGHPVVQVRARPSLVRLDPDATLMLLDPARPLAPSDAAALARFVSEGGALVVGGRTGPWLTQIVPDPPAWSPEQPEALHLLVPLPAFLAADRVESAGSGLWSGGAALPVLGSSRGSLLDLAQLGRGHVWLLSSVAPLQNRLLAEAQDAAFGLALAGARGRPVEFLELYHGYGPASGYAAVPGRWWVAFTLLGAAALTLMLAAGRRFGPPTATERALAPPRRDYVEALAGILARSNQPDAALRPVREHLRRAIAERAGLGGAASDEQIRAAAGVVGIPTDDVDALLRPALSEGDLVTVGRTLVRLTRQSPP